MGNTQGNTVPTARCPAFARALEDEGILDLSSMGAPQCPAFARVLEDEGILCLFGHSRMSDENYLCKRRRDGLETFVSFTKPGTYLYTDEMKELVTEFRKKNIPHEIPVRKGRESSDVRLRLTTEFTPNYAFNTRRDPKVEDLCKLALGFWLFTPNNGDNYDSGGRLAGWGNHAKQHTGYIRYLGRSGEETVSDGGTYDVAYAFTLAQKYNVRHVCGLGCKGY